MTNIISECINLRNYCSENEGGKGPDLFIGGSFRGEVKSLYRKCFQEEKGVSLLESRKGEISGGCPRRQDP